MMRGFLSGSEQPEPMKFWIELMSFLFPVLRFGVGYRFLFPFGISVPPVTANAHDPQYPAVAWREHERLLYYDEDDEWPTD